MKILIAYYSRTGSTEALAEAIKKTLELRGHLVDVEKIMPIKEHGFLAWFFIRFFRGVCDIQPPKIRDVSTYNLICVGSPNWTRLSLPVAKYLTLIRGLEYKNIGFFATTGLVPQIEWYLFSAYLLDVSISRTLRQKGARLIDSILLSNIFKRWSVLSEYGKRTIESFCDKITAPTFSLKDYFLNQSEVENNRLLVVIFSTLLLISLFTQVVLTILGVKVFTLTEFFSLFIIGLFAYFSILTILMGRAFIFWGKYLASISFFSVFTIAVLFLTPAVSQLIVLGYILIFILLTLFHEPKVIIFSAISSIACYYYLIFNYSPQRVFYPALDIPLILIGAGITTFLTGNLKNYYITLLETQDEIETARIVLEIKVKARTMELERLTTALEEKVKLRTQELQERIKDLEGFQGLTVGRELKMVELKAEIVKLRKELEKRSEK